MAGGGELNRLTWWEDALAWVNYWSCVVRGHPENPAMPGFCRCGDYQPSKSGVPMTHIDQWESA